MILAADLDFMQIVIYAAVLVAGLLSALLHKRKPNREQEGQPPLPPRERSVPRAGRVEPQEPIVILPPERPPAPRPPPAPARPVPPPRERPASETTRLPRPAPARGARAQPVGQRPAPARVVPVEAARAIAPEQPPSLPARARLVPGVVAVEPAEAAAPARRVIPIGGLVRALLARPDGAAAALVVSEILAPPVSLRQNDPARLI